MPQGHRSLLIPELVFPAASSSPANKGLILLVTGVTLALIQRRSEQYIAAKRKKAEVSGQHSEEIVELPPPDLEFDDRDPCTLPGVLEGLGDPGVGECVPPKDFEAAGTIVPFAKGAEDPLWPVLTQDKKKIKVSYKDVRGKFHGKWGRHFGTLRKGEHGIRRHAGIDLFANIGDIVVAMEDGTVISTLPFTDGTWALYVLNDTGEIINYGELKKGSWKQFGIDGGFYTTQRIKRGQPLGTVGATEMLHLETIKGDTTVDEIRKRQLQWPDGHPAPEQLLDPSQYLVTAQRLWFEHKLKEEIG